MLLWFLDSESSLGFTWNISMKSHHLLPAVLMWRRLGLALAQVGGEGGGEGGIDGVSISSCQNVIVN